MCALPVVLDVVLCALHFSLLEVLYGFPVVQQDVLCSLSLKLHMVLFDMPVLMHATLSTQPVTPNSPLCTEITAHRSVP
jgi:hypothetical protein